ncbi:MAG: TM2 domain-containing protein [Bacteroidaceae bacterium]|nr:TM2 domain-containing protein [Bacteroidaceae bacterium]
MSSELYKNQIEGFKRSIESYKKDIARYRDTLKNNPRFSASQKASYKLMIEGRQKEIKMFQNMIAATKKTLAAAIENEKEEKKRKQEKIKKEKEKAREDKKRQQEEDKKRTREEANKKPEKTREASASRSSSYVSRSSSTLSSIGSSVVSASIAASSSTSSPFYYKSSTDTHSEPSHFRTETISSYSTKSNGISSDVNRSKEHSKTKSSRNWIVTLILCLFFGVFGAHRFYAGKIGTGILQLFTVGGYFIWTLWDLAHILNGKFTDSEGNDIRL